MTPSLPLSAALSSDALVVILRVDAIQAAALEAVARAYADDPDTVAVALEQLGHALERTTHPDDDTGQHPAAVDDAREELEAVADLGYATVDLSHDQALRLAGQILNATSGTLTARIREAA